MDGWMSNREETKKEEVLFPPGKKKSMGSAWGLQF